MEKFLQIDIKTILSLEKSKRQRNFMARHMILKSEHQMQRRSKGRPSATVCYAITCDSSISYGCWLLYFRFSFLWMHLGKQWEVAHVLGPMPHTWENGWKLLAPVIFGLAQLHWLQPKFGDWASNWKIPPLPLSSSTLQLCLSKKLIN